MFGVFHQLVVLVGLDMNETKQKNNLSFSLIAAYSLNKVIGKKGKIPWHLSSDLKRFKALTENKIVVMGRKTYESIGKPLKNRINIVITSNVNFADKFTYSKPEMMGITDVCGAVQLCKHLTDFFPQDSAAKEIMIIGGQKIYEQFLPMANKMYLTEVGLEIENGDAFFPEFEKTQWLEKEKVEIAETMALVDNIKSHITIPYTYKVFERVSS